MQRDDIVTIFEEITLLLELKGENSFKIRAYKNAADILKNTTLDFIALTKENKLQLIDGIGTAIKEKIETIVTTGKLPYYEALKQEFPETLFELFSISGLGAKKIKSLYDNLNIDSLIKLEKCCQDGSVEKLSGFGKKTVENLIDAIAFKKEFASYFRLGEISPLAVTMRELLLDHPKISLCEIAGSYRRAKEILHDLDFLVASSNPQEVIDYFISLPQVYKIISKGSTKAQIYLENGLQCDLRVVTNAQFPFALQYFSGSKEHNVILRNRAKKIGLSLNEYDFTAIDKNTQAPICNTEQEIYLHLKLDYIEPELRENNGEIEAAENGKLPRLINLENIKGTFHNHTTASDGKSTLSEMAEAARELGLQYLGIADHSKSSFQANGLYPDRLLKQVEEIKRLNTQWNDFKLLSGSEVDILKDGSLDFEDSVLKQLDYVVASVHNAFTLSEEDMTKRIIQAMENPYVNMIGHLTGRLLLKRKPYAVNVQKIIDCAAETGTIIELNANYYRLDMDWRWWKIAKERGVKCAINPDAHHVDHLQFIHYGVRLARKGWLTKNDVINTLNYEDMLNFIKNQRHS